MNELTKIEAKSKRAKVSKLPSTDNPIEELRRLVRMHAAGQRTAVSLHNQRSDRTSKKTKEPIPCRLSIAARAALAVAEDAVKAEVEIVERAMTRTLKRVPIYRYFLSKVYGLGPVAGGYLVSEIDIHKATKPSALRMFCGFAVINGRLVRRVAGQKNRYNAALRTKIYTAFTSMVRNAKKKTAARPSGTTSKYLDVWEGVKHREMSSERVDVAANKWRDMDGEWHGGARSHALKKGWHKAADVMIDDIYMVWRALEGLPVWPTYYEAKLHYEHGGIPLRDLGPRSLTLAEAIERVGDVGGRPAATPIDVEPLHVPEIEDDIDAINSDGGEAE